MMNRLLMTGAAGGLGTQMRTRLKHLAPNMRLSDIVDVKDPEAHEEVVTCDLGDKAAVEELVKDCDGIVHFGGVATEHPWDPICNANISGLVYLYEAARKHGHPRIMFASSNHAVGFHPQNKVIDNTVYPQPDGLYGVSKVFGEALANAYHSKFGIETAIVRIGSCFPKPTDHRMLSTWLSYDDLAGLIGRIFDVPRLGCPIIYGVSNNTASFWDNRQVKWIGWQPQDNAEDYRAEVDAAKSKPAKDAPEVLWIGGAYTADKIHE